MGMGHGMGQTHLHPCEHNNCYALWANALPTVSRVQTRLAFGHLSLELG